MSQPGSQGGPAERVAASRVNAPVIKVAAASILFASATALSAQALPARLETPPPAKILFERDWVLMNWALKSYDFNRDILLDASEAGAAADAFRKMADKDGDGRVTPDEYRAAREAILTRG